MDIIDLDADPLRQLAAWLDAARSAGEPPGPGVVVVEGARLIPFRVLAHGPRG